MQTQEMKISSNQSCFTAKKEVGMVAKQEHVSIIQDIECTCKIQWYTIIMLTLSILGIVFFIFLKLRNLKLFRGHLSQTQLK